MKKMANSNVNTKICYPGACQFGNSLWSIAGLFLMYLRGMKTTMEIQLKMALFAITWAAHCFPPKINHGHRICVKAIEKVHS